MKKKLPTIKKGKLIGHWHPLQPYVERIADSLEIIAQHFKTTEQTITNVPTQKKLVIKDFPEFIGKPIQQLYDHLKKEYPNQLAGEHEIADIFKNHENYPELKDGNWYYFFGASFVDSNGGRRVPCGRWDGSQWNRHGSWLGSDWDASGRVVLLGNPKK